MLRRVTSRTAGEVGQKVLSLLSDQVSNLAELVVGKFLRVGDVPLLSPSRAHELARVAAARRNRNVHVSAVERVERLRGVGGEVVAVLGPEPARAGSPCPAAAIRRSGPRPHRRRASDSSWRSRRTRTKPASSGSTGSRLAPPEMEPAQQPASWAQTHMPTSSDPKRSEVNSGLWTGKRLFRRLDRHRNGDGR